MSLFEGDATLRRVKPQHLKVVNIKNPVPNELSPEKAKYNKDLMTKTLRGEASIIGTFIIKPEIIKNEGEDEEDSLQQQPEDEKNTMMPGEEQEEIQDNQKEPSNNEVEIVQDEEYFKRLRSNEIRKRFYLKVAREYNLQEFFEDDKCNAKMQATVEADFMFGEKRRDESPEETSKIRWEKFMNVLLPDKTNKKVVDMIKFLHNEYSIINRNMPFMFKQLSPEEIKQMQLKEQKLLEQQMNQKSNKIKITHTLNKQINFADEQPPPNNQPEQVGFPSPFMQKNLKQKASMANLKVEAQKLKDDLDKSGQYLDQFRRFSIKINSLSAQKNSKSTSNVSMFERHRRQRQNQQQLSEKNNQYMKENGKNYRLEMLNEKEKNKREVEVKRKQYSVSINDSKNDYQLNTPQIILTPAAGDTQPTILQQRVMISNTSMVNQSLNQDLYSSLISNQEYKTTPIKMNRNKLKDRMKTLSPTGHSSQEHYRMMYLKRYLTALQEYKSDYHSNPPGHSEALTQMSDYQLEDLKSLLDNALNPITKSRTQMNRNADSYIGIPLSHHKLSQQHTNKVLQTYMPQHYSQASMDHTMNEKEPAISQHLTQLEGDDQNNRNIGPKKIMIKNRDNFMVPSQSSLGMGNRKMSKGQLLLNFYHKDDQERRRQKQSKIIILPDIYSKL